MNVLDFNDPDMLERVRLRKEAEAQKITARDELRVGLDNEQIQDIEYALIGSFINNSHLLDEGKGLKSIHFGDAITRHIFKVLQTRHDEGGITDALILKKHLKDNPFLWDLKSNSEEIVDLYAGCGLQSPLQVRAYADLLLDHNNKIDVKAALSQASNQLFNSNFTANDVLQSLNHAFADIYEDSSDDVIGLMGINETLSQPPLQWILNGYLQEETISCLYAPSFSGKSYLALDMALSVAQGTDWHGHDTKPLQVVYIAAEGARGMSLRANAWLSARQRSDSPLGFSFYRQPLDFFDVSQVNHFIRLCEGVDAGLIIIDTLARCFGGRDENSTQDMNAFINSVDRVKRILGAHVMIVHHTGKDVTRGARGSSAFKAAIDTEIEVKKEDNNPLMEIIVRKQKDGDLQGRKLLEFKDQDCHHPVTGEVLSSAILRPYETPGRAPSQRLGKNELAVMRVLAGGESGFGYIQVQTGIEKGNLSRALRSLKEKGLIDDDEQSPATYRKIANV